MKRPSPRTITTVVTALLAIVVLFLNLPRPQAATPFTQLATDSAVAKGPVWQIETDTLRSGETLSGLLTRGGVDPGDVAPIMEAATGLDARRAPVGMPVIVKRAAGDSTPTEITFQLAVDRLLHVRRTSDSTWVGTEEALPWKTDTLAVSGVIAANLYQAIDDSAAELPTAARAELAWALADVYEYRVDMSRELHSGDRFRVMFQRSIGPGGITRIGDIIAVRFDLSGSEMDAVRFDVNGREEYYDQTGRSMRSSFLRAPVEFRRISSGFGMRFHPILGYTRMHEGIDYAANSGTPVRAIGDGVVTFAGRRGGYGNMIEIRHPNGFRTRYGHLRGFAKGIRAGRTVTIGQTIGYVGMTGLATGPHLHFEVLVDGVHRNPLLALKGVGGPPLPVADRARFDSTRTALLAMLDSAPGATRLASR